MRLLHEGCGEGTKFYSLPHDVLGKARPGHTRRRIRHRTSADCSSGGRYAPPGPDADQRGCDSSVARVSQRGSGRRTTRSGLTARIRQQPSWLAVRGQGIPLDRQPFASKRVIASITPPSAATLPRDERRRRPLRARIPGAGRAHGPRVPGLRHVPVREPRLQRLVVRVRGGAEHVHPRRDRVGPGRRLRVVRLQPARRPVHVARGPAHGSVRGEAPGRDLARRHWDPDPADRDPRTPGHADPDPDRARLRHGRLPDPRAARRSSRS